MTVTTVSGEPANTSLFQGNFSRALRRAATVVALLATFAIVFAAILLLISALNLQRSVTTDIDNTIVATVGQVRLDIETLNMLEDEARASSAVLATTDRALANDDALLDEGKQAVARAIRELATKTPELPAANIYLPTTGSHDSDTLRLTDRVAMYRDLVQKNSPNAKPELIDGFFDKLADAIATTMNDYIRTRDRWFDENTRKSGLMARLNELKDGPKASGSVRLANESYKNVVEDFRTFQALVGKTLFGIVLIPNPVLVLLLAVFMGMLGGLIHLSCRVVIGGDDVKASEMFFRIGLGAAVALALFFFASAGVLSLSQAKGGSDGSEMSPYLISFLGITAGFMSERVTAWMREIGERTFKLQDGAERDRWGPGIAAEMAKQGIAKEAVAAALGNTVEEIEAWMALSKSVADRDQRLLAAYLRVHKSRLFTDVDPKEPAG